MNDTINPLFFYTFIKTKTDATELHEHLSALSEALFATTDPVEGILTKTLAYNKVTLLKQLATEYKIDLQNKMQVQSLVKAFDEAVMSLPLVNLTVAIDPKLELIDSIHHWFYRVFKQPVILEIAINPLLIGGSEIRYNGKMADYSLRKLIKEQTEHTT